MTPHKLFLLKIFIEFHSFYEISKPDGTFFVIVLKPIKNINHYELAKLIKKNSKKEVICIENQFDLERFIKLHAYGNEIIVCMGAGSISSWIRDIAVNLKNEH